jgi:hypothetical protein
MSKNTNVSLLVLTYEVEQRHGKQFHQYQQYEEPHDLDIKGVNNVYFILNNLLCISLLTLYGTFIIQQANTIVFFIIQ